MTDNPPDAGLLRLNAEYRALIAEQNAGKHRDASGDVTDESMERLSAIERKIADTPAESYAGVGVKLLIAVDNFDPLDPGKTRTTDELNLESALADAERLAGATSSTVAPETTGEDPFEALAAEWAEQKAECERLHKAFDEAWERLPRWVRDDKGAPQRLNPKTGLMEYYISGERRELMARMKRARDEAGTTDLGGQSDAAEERLGEIEQRIAETPTPTILGIATKLRAEAFAEVEYEFTTTENVIKTALAGAEHLLAQSQETDAELLALKVNIANEYAAFETKKGKTDDEADAWAGRLSDMDHQFAEMPVHTLPGVAAKLRCLHDLLVTDGSVRSQDISLVETSLAAVEQVNKAEGKPAALSPTRQ